MPHSSPVGPPKQEELTEEFHAMKLSLFALAWLFVFTVAGYDMYFAWQYRSAFQSWEMNPAARWVAGWCGLATVFCLKCLLLAFAALVGVCCYRCRHRLTAPYTAVVSGLHLWLSVQYVRGLFL
jgi:hypothetical protein